jgi:hypothetical protein
MRWWASSFLVLAVGLAPGMAAVPSEASTASGSIFSREQVWPGWVPADAKLTRKILKDVSRDLELSAGRMARLTPSCQYVSVLISDPTVAAYRQRPSSTSQSRCFFEANDGEDTLVVKSGGKWLVAGLLPGSNGFDPYCAYRGDVYEGDQREVWQGTGDLTEAQKMSVVRTGVCERSTTAPGALAVTRTPEGYLIWAEQSQPFFVTGQVWFEGRLVEEFLSPNLKYGIPDDSGWGPMEEGTGGDYAVDGRWLPAGKTITVVYRPNNVFGSGPEYRVSFTTIEHVYQPACRYNPLASCNELV